MEVLQIIPQVRQACGLTDYSRLLAVQLDEEHGMHTGMVAAFVRADGGNVDARFPLYLLNTRKKSLDALKDKTDYIVLHYVGYGFEKRGCPSWLLAGLRRLKHLNPQMRLVTMFHELYAFGKPWQSSFWTSPMQRRICGELARLSDEVVTSREDSAVILRRMSGRRDVHNLPIFSNVGEPKSRTPFGARAERMVIFGGEGWRTRALSEDREEIRLACQTWGVKEILEIGTGETPNCDLGVPVRKLGALAAEEVSAILAEARFGFVSYPSSYLEKSGIYAAYAAHGVIPVLPERSMVENTLGVKAGRHFLNANSGEKSELYFEEMSDQVYSWYQSHTVAKHAEVFAKLLNS